MISDKVYVIAEAGVNHNGDLSLAKKLIDVAVDAKADAVKFQTFKAEELTSKIAPQAKYQEENMGIKKPQIDMLKDLELNMEDYIKLYEYAKTKNITFVSTAFDAKNMKFLVDNCHMPFLKIPSGETTNYPYLYNVAKHQIPIILSTGMSTLEEVEQSLAILAYGFAAKREPTNLTECLGFCKTDEAKNIIKKNITVLHCTTEYPSPYEDINLRAMKTIKDKFGVKVGLSDHSKGAHIPVAAVAMGAELIEKHFTLDRNMKGPDHKASLEPNELKEMISQIRDIEKALGDAKKEPKASEIKNINVARRSLVAKENIKKGETYTANNIMCKRPGGGVSAIKYWDYLGKKAPIDIIKDEFVK